MAVSGMADLLVVALQTLNPESSPGDPPKREPPSRLFHMHSSPAPGWRARRPMMKCLDLSFHVKELRSCPRSSPTTYEAPGESGSPVELKERYENFIGGQWIAPTTGEYRDNLTPSTGNPFCELAHSGARDIELALDAAHAAKVRTGRVAANPQLKRRNTRMPEQLREATIRPQHHHR
jgi:hypothetical protein